MIIMRMAPKLKIDRRVQEFYDMFHDSIRMNILDDHDFAYVHIEAPDECGHMGDAALKTQAIEAFDERVVGPILSELERRGEAYRLLVCMDHRTPVSIRGHTAEPVPMARLDGPVGDLSDEAAFDETFNGGQAQCAAHEWMQELLRPSSDTPVRDQPP